MYHNPSWCLQIFHTIPCFVTILSRLFDEGRICDLSWLVMCNFTLKISKYFSHVCIYPVQNMTGNIACARDNSDMYWYLVQSLLPRLCLSSKHSRFRHSLHSPHTCLNYPKIMWNYQSQYPPTSKQSTMLSVPPHNARPTTPHFPTRYTLNLCRTVNSNQRRPSISLQVSQRPDSKTANCRNILMSVVFALTTPFPLFRVEIYQNNSQTLHRPAGKLDTNRNNKMTCINWCVLTVVGESYRVVCVCGWVCVCVCVCVCMRV